MSYFINKLKDISIDCPKIILETGTYLGEGVQSYLDTNYFDKIYSIELSNKYYLINKQQFNDKRVNILKGDSSQVIQNLIDNSLLEDRPILFYLDAHFSGADTDGKDICNGCPVLNELKVISNRNVKGDIIFIDDMRLMGKSSWSGTPGCTKYPVTYFDFSHVTHENIMKAINRNIKVFKIFDDIDRLLIILD